MPRSEWREVSCCETKAGQQKPKVAIRVRIAAKGPSLGVVFKAGHPCGLQNYRVDVTVFDAAGNAWAWPPITETFDCGDKVTASVDVRWLWAAAKIVGGGPAATYMGKLPDRITQATVDANVQSCCGTVEDVTVSS
jgi:hypothetical protein